MRNLKEENLINSSLPKESKNLDFSKIKVGLKSIEDVIYNSETALKKTNSSFTDKNFVLKAINNGDIEALRNISEFYYKTSGIYSRLCRYMAFLYRYDWMLVPYINNNSMPKEKILDGFYKTLNFLDNFNVKANLGQIALRVIRTGSYYGYIIYTKDSAQIQELPAKYCRSRFKKGVKPVIEFNLKYFDDTFRDVNQKMKMLKLFPPEFSKGYILYKQGKLKPDFAGDTNGWYMLDPELGIKFSMNDEDQPMFISTVPAIIDLDAAQEMDRKKMAQQLLKIIIQKMPLDKNGELVFDMDEMQVLHSNAKKMLGSRLGTEVLTTVADTKVEDMADNNTTTTTDELQKVERTVYNDAGVSQKQFNTDSNIALEKSILNDEASIYNLLLQFEDFLNHLIKPYNKNSKKMNLKVQILTTTIYNHKEMSKLFKEQTQIGYSKLLPQIALGQSQSSILASAYFENEILDLNSIFIPPSMSSTMSGKISSKSTNGSSDKEVGRTEKPDDEKSEKTIRNKESMN